MKDKEPILLCPWCKDGAEVGGYDLIGLKNHIEHGDCDVFNNCEKIERLL